MKEIKLTQGKVALVDDDMYDELNKFKWCAHNHKNLWYAVRTDGKFPFKKTVLMHRVVTNALAGTMVDHINGDGLCNLRKNLRICTRAENQHNRGKTRINTSGYKGVYKRGRKWMAEIKVNENKIYLGLWDTREEAARAYDEAAKKFHGEYAKFNL